MPETYDPNDPGLKSWVEVQAGSDFPIQNLPFGVFQAPGREPRVGAAIGDSLVDLAELAALNYLLDLDPPDLLSVFSSQSLNALIGLGKPYCRKVRARLSWLLNAANPELRERPEHRDRVLLKQTDLKMLLPVEVGDFVDFYSSLEHATNVGRMFRPESPLLPNWKHLPVGYHGRTSSIIPSGQDIRRPKGQIKPKDGAPGFGPTRKLDFELEMGFVVGKESELGKSLSTSEADDYIFGMVLLNDWSARDIQQWEYVPLGPFLGKSFATSITPWVVTMEALEPFQTEGPRQEPPVLPYLRFEGKKNLDLHLEVDLQPDSEAQPMRVCRSNFKHMYWNMNQQLAHLTSNGTNVRVGDLCGSGTVSGPNPQAYGSMLELCWNGEKPLGFPGGSVRTFLEDQDTVVLRGYGEREGLRIGFGELRSKILPALE